MARNNPVRIWMIKQKPNKEPMFHHNEIFLGAGRSIKALLIRLIGLENRVGVFIILSERDNF